MRRVAGGIDGMEAVFDDGSLVADAGLLLAGTVVSRLGLEALIDDTVRLGGSAGAGRGPQGVDAGVVGAGGGPLHRRHRPAAVGRVGCGAAL